MPVRLLAVLVVSLVSINGVAAEPYVPDSNAKVLERLPFKPNDPIARELAQMRQELKRDPRNAEIAVKLARRYYEMVSEEGDPRYLGYAQAALSPWWDMPTPPVDIQILRASLRQFLHDFSGAVTDLDEVLQRDRYNPQALSLRAIIHIVQARYSQGMADCRALRHEGDPLIAQGCEAMVDGLTGKAGPAYAALNPMVESATSLISSKKLWLEIRLAELAERQGRADRAEMHFKRALSLGISDTFLLAAYADLLLAQKRPGDVMNLLRDRTRSDVLLLRLVFAARALKLPTARGLEDMLAARYAAAQMRGETVHQQEEARFALDVLGDANKSLGLAMENWKVQREPRDAEIFLRAAIAMKDRESAKSVLKWLEVSNIEDAHLLRLGQHLRGMRP